MNRWNILAVALVAVLMWSSPAEAAAYGPDFMGGMLTIAGSMTYTDGSIATHNSGPISLSEALASGHGWDFGAVYEVCAFRVVLAAPLAAGDEVRLYWGETGGDGVVMWPGDRDAGETVLEWHSPSQALLIRYLWLVIEGGALVAEVYSWEYPEQGSECVPLSEPSDPPGGDGDSRWGNVPPSGTGPITTPPTGSSECDDPWRRDPRTGYCYDWWGRTENVIGNRGLAAYPSGTTWDGTTAQWVGIPDVDYYSVQYMPEHLEGTAGWPRLVAGCEAVPGSWSAGALLGCLVSDKDNLVARRYTVRVAAWRNGVVVADSTFTVEGARHVELGYYTMSRFERWFDELKELLSVQDAESRAALQRIENSLNRLRRWGPFGAADDAAERVTEFVEGIRSGDRVPVSELECDGDFEFFCFPLSLPQYGLDVKFQFPIAQILAIEEWQVVWNVISATMWASFGLWVLSRVSPRLHT